MKALNKCAAVCLCLSFAANFAACDGAGGGSTGSSGDADDEIVYNDVLNDRLVPIWADGGVAINETAFVLQEKDGTILPITLTYPIDEIISVKDFSLENEYAEIIDYAIEDGRLIIKENGNIPSLEYSGFFYDLYVGDDSMWANASGVGGQMRTEAIYKDGVNYRGLTQWQVAVTYRHSEKWQGETPADKSRKFQKLNEKLARGEQTNIVCLGDSISAGWTASGYEYVFLPPYCPPYFDLITEYMQGKRWNVTAKNFSVGGMTSNWGKDEKQIGDVISANPDFLIIAFGMNDGSNNDSVPVSLFKNNIKTIIDEVRKAKPECEVLLVSTMLPNKDVGYFLGTSIMYNQKNYLAALNELENEYTGVAVADVTTAHEYLLSKKHFRDMSSNNINHPNDYVQRLYAQICLTAMFGEIERVEEIESL